MPIATVRGAQLNYIDKGEGIHRVVFLHDLLQTSAIWQSLMEAMPEGEFRCLAFDLRGCGGSSNPLAGFSIDSLADDVRHVLHELGIKRCSMVASGVGGSVGLSMAARYPHFVYKLIVSGASAVARDRKAAIAEAERLAGVEWNEEAIAVEIEKRLAKKPRASVLTKMVRDALKGQRDATAAIASAHARTSLLDLLPRMEAKTLILVGGKDQFCAREDAELLSMNVPRVESKAIPTAGHWPMIDTPRIYRDHVLELLRRI